MLFKNIQTQKVSHKFLWVFFGNIVFFMIAAYLFPIRFEQNDDVIMLLFASGKYSGIPEAHLVFINYVYGLLLKFLYTWNNQIEWYSVLFAFFHIASMSVISWFILNNKKVLRVYKILFLILFYLIEIRFILLFQFTTTAALCAFAGIVLMFYSNNYRQYIGVIFFIIATLVRFEAAFLVLLIICPIFIRSVYRNKRLVFAMPLQILSLALIFAFLFKFINSRAYQTDKNWRYYYQYNKVRGQINDNPNAAKIGDYLPSHIHQSDYKLLLSFIPDGKIMSLNKLTILEKMINNVNFKIKLGNILPALKIFDRFIFLLVFLLLVAFINKRDKLQRLILLGVLFTFLFALFYISLNGSLKARVFLSAILPFMFLIFISLEHNYCRPNLFFILGIIMFGFFFAKQNYYTWNYSRNYRASEVSQQFKILGEYLQNKENSVVPFANNLNVEYFNPFKIPSLFNKHQIFFSGWTTNIPINYSYLDSLTDLINRHSIFFRKEEYARIFPVLQDNIWQNYHLKVQSQTQIESQDYIIIKMVLE